MLFLNDGLLFIYRIHEELIDIKEELILLVNYKKENIEIEKIKELLERDGKFIKINEQFLAKKYDKGYLIFEIIEQRRDKYNPEFLIFKLNFNGYYRKSNEEEMKKELEKKEN